MEGGILVINKKDKIKATKHTRITVVVPSLLGLMGVEFSLCLLGSSEGIFAAVVSRHCEKSNTGRK